jgi:hypothetical protein
MQGKLFSYWETFKIGRPSKSTKNGTMFSFHLYLDRSVNIAQSQSIQATDTNFLA